MKKCNKILLAIFVVSTIVVGAVAAIAVYKTKFKKKYITVCD